MKWDQLREIFKSISVKFHYIFKKIFPSGNTENLSEENKNSVEYINYEYLDDETGISKIGISYYFYVVSNMNDYKLMI